MTQVIEGQEEVEAGQGESVEAGEVEGVEKPKRGSPTYAVQAIDELPPNHRGEAFGGGRSRAAIYTPLLAQVIAQPGQWFELARFTSVTGARLSAKSVGEAIEKAEIPVAGGEFQFDTRRRVNTGEVNEDGTAKVIPSVLYAKFVVEGTETEGE